MAEDKKELDSVTETIKNIGNGRMCQIETHYYQQREAMNTILPFKLVVVGCKINQLLALYQIKRKKNPKE